MSATKLLRFLAKTVVHGNPELAVRTLPALPLPKPVLPKVDLRSPVPDGTRQRLHALGAAGFAQWMLEQELAVDIDPGKTLLVVLQSVSPDGDKAIKVQFELNGRSVTIINNN